MEIKINREIRNYSESMFFGLSLRQLVFTAIGIVVAVGLYFLLQPYCGMETRSWACMLGAAPFIACGFITYNGMTAEQFAVVWFRSKLLEPIKVKFTCDSNFIVKREKEKMKGGKISEIHKKYFKQRQGSVSDPEIGSG